MEKEEVIIKTEFENFSELPPKLINIFKLEKNKNKSWVNLETGAFVPLTISSTHCPKSLLLAGCTLIGAGIGSIISLSGIIIGGLAGLILALIALSFNKNLNYVIKLKIDSNSKLKIIAKPE